MMMLGDADQNAYVPPPQPILANANAANNNNNNNNANEATRLQNSIDFLKNNGTNRHLVFRRRAAEELRLLITARPTITDELKNDVIDIFCKILKKPREDTLVLEQILWTITNLSHANSPLIHEMHTKDMVKMIAFHAKNCTANTVRDQAIMCLGNIAADCQPCRLIVMKTNIIEFVLDVLQTPANLNANQRDTFAWTLQNIIRPSNPSDSLTLSVRDRMKMVKLVQGLISLPPPDDSINQGVEILHDWVMVDSDKVVGQMVVGNEELMANLIRMFEAQDDEKSSKIIRAIGNIAFNDDDVIQNIIDHGFVTAMEARLISSGCVLEADIIWCLSNILGSLRPTCVQDIYNRTELWELLIRNCYNYDVKIRREALFCIINILSFFKGDAQDKLYHQFFGQLIIDTLDGFTIEDSASMSQAVQGILTHTNDEMRTKNPNLKDLIFEYGFEAAVKRRYEWTQTAIQTFDLTPTARKELFKLLNLCVDSMNLIKEYKAMQIYANPFLSHPLATSTPKASFSSPPMISRRDPRAFGTKENNVSPIFKNRL